MGAEASTVYELEDRSNELVVRLARGEKKRPLERITLKVGEGIAGTVVKTGKPMVIQDVSRKRNSRTESTGSQDFEPNPRSASPSSCETGPWALFR